MLLSLFLCIKPIRNTIIIHEIQAITAYILYKKKKLIHGRFDNLMLF